VIRHLLGRGSAVNRDVLRVAWYRFRVTFGGRWRGYLSLVLLIGLTGGVSMGAAAEPGVPNLPLMPRPAVCTHRICSR
jgi:hypothetical protein